MDNQKNDKAFSIMTKMGYKEGAGLGKNETGILHPINVAYQYHKNGFGHDPYYEKQAVTELWDGEDAANIEEDLLWIHSNNSESTKVTYDDLLLYIVRGVPLTSLENEVHFCDLQVLKAVLETKENIFLTLDATDLCKARTRANQYESIKSAFFMNRAALKMANIDAATSFMFTNIDRDPRHKKEIGPYYFADVCAGPGGFSEYILWRKRWSFKGFGFTLRGVHDFKVGNSTCASDATFRGYYGVMDDGNVCNPDNINDFTRRVMHETDNEGVHFMMSDGGFSVEGNEGIQEILSKQIYICQCLVALEIVRKHGHFVTKLFDTFTAFSVGLLYLMYLCFDKVAVLKPNSSRPANSERYFICSGLKDSGIVEEVRKYLRFIINEMWQLREVNKDSIDINEIVPIDAIKCDANFYEYIRSQNTKMAEVQTKSLEKLAIFCKNPHLIDGKQVELRSRCLEYWRIPNVGKMQSDKLNPDDLLYHIISKPELLYVPACKIATLATLHRHVSDVNDWTYVPLSSSGNLNRCYIFIAAGNTSTYKLQDHKWVKVKGIRLVKGTLLYGELVNEYCSAADSVARQEIKALHVIDALRLGDTSLADLNYLERRDLIATYCKSINFETVPGQTRVRAMCSDKLANLGIKSLVNYSVAEDSYYTLLPTIGYGEFREHFDVSSILIMKADENHYFNTTYVLRAQIFIDKTEELSEDILRYNQLLQFVKEKL